MTVGEWVIGVLLFGFVATEWWTYYLNRRNRRLAEEALERARKVKAKAERDVDAAARESDKARWVVGVANRILEQAGLGRIEVNDYVTRGGLDEVIDGGGDDG